MCSVAGGTGVDSLLGVDGDTLDQVLVGELPDGSASEGAVNLEPLNNGGRSNELHLGHINEELVSSGLVEHDHVLGLLANPSLGPLLLALLGSSGHGRPGLLLLCLLFDLLRL